jgi:uncharacterized membrane protein YcaP (DUF421 family)
MTGILVRITATYVFLLLLVRLAGKQPLGRDSAFDWLVAVVLGDFADDVVLGEVPFVQASVAVTTIVLLHAWVGMLACRSRTFERLVASAPAVLLRHGTVQRAAAAREHLSASEFDGMLRLESVDDPREAAVARLEPSGQLSALRTPAAQTAPHAELPRLRRLLGNRRDA